MDAASQPFPNRIQELFVLNCIETTATKRTKNGLSFKKGFTLIELLVVIAIIAILASILFPVFSRARENARKSSCASNMKQVGLALQMYSQDYDERMMIVWAGTDERWPDVFTKSYIKSSTFLYCPSSNYGTAGFASSYTYYPSFGYNYAYLSPGPGCPQGPDSTLTTVTTCASAPVSGQGTTGIALSQMDAPSETLAMAESNIYDAANGWNKGFYVVRPPHLWRAYNGDASPHSDLYGRVAAGRHNGMNNVLFADGHVKAQKLDALRNQNLWRAVKNPPVVTSPTNPAVA